LLRHILNFIRRIIVSIAPRVVDARERESASLGESIKAINTTRWLECNAHAGCGHDGVKVASNRVLHRVCIQYETLAASAKSAAKRKTQ
jgi:hypothetical protein